MLVLARYRQRLAHLVTGSFALDGRRQWRVSQFRALLLLTGAVCITPLLIGVSAQSPPCDIACENAKPGDPASEWDIEGAGDPSIQGYATDISVDQGQTVRFKVDTDALAYQIDIYRLGFYGGLGARKVATVLPTVAPPQVQPSCLSDPSTGLVDCGNWAESASWTVPTDATSGVYIAKLVRPDTNGASHIVFVVRDDDGHSDLLFQTSDTTWQAYNDYGGNSLYVGSPAGRAYKVSYNRPFVTRGNPFRRGWLFGAEYPMIRWMEANGYDVSYSTGVDSDRRGQELLEHKVFLSVGHDEYWSGNQRANVEAARAAGIHLAFFSGDEVFWKTRWENSISPSGTPYRTLVTYKETHANAKIDPLPNVWTGTWRDKRFSPPADGGRPENALTGTIFMVNCCPPPLALKISDSEGKLRFWRNTSVANLAPGQTASVAPGILGYEFDEEQNNGSRPPGLMRLSTSTYGVSTYLQDNGSNYGSGTVTHALTLYRHSSGALVFGAGTIRWSWALDVNHDSDSATPGILPSPEPVIQQATVNLLADMGVQPVTLQGGLVPASSSNDSMPPTSVISSPTAGTTVQTGTSVTITGTASDIDGIVSAVEVSVDGGNTWQRANGKSSWTYSWTPSTTGNVTIRSRAIDDSGNIESPGASVGVIVEARACPCTIWDASATPAIATVNDPTPVEVGVKFTTEVDGFITALRFYKGSGNTGTHVGNLWTTGGTLLGSVTFANETPSGWQQATLANPIPIAANTTYVASYHTNSGGYSGTGFYFATTGQDSSPLHALQDGVDGPNGVYAYGPSAFPTETFNSNNYWVDVVFATSVGPDTTPPQISGIAAVPGANGIADITWTTDEPSSSRVDYGLSPGSLGQFVANPALVTSHSIRLTGLVQDSTYYFRVRSTDGASNTAIAPALSDSPATFTSSAHSTVIDTTTTDFSAGSFSGTSVVQSADGEVILTPAAGAEFTGSSIPPGWSAVPWSASGTAIVGAGALTVDGARVSTDALYSAGRSLEFVATFQPAAHQHAGFAITLNETPYMVFSTFGGGALYARTHDGAQPTDTLLPGNWLGAPHRYRINWTATGVVYSIDGVEVANHPMAIATALRPIASDFDAGGDALSVDWIRMSPYTASGTFLSRVLDAGGPTTWGTASWTATTQVGTTIDLQARTGDTPVPDATWTTFVTIPSPGSTLGMSGRYLQYHADLASTVPSQTPVLQDVSFGTGTTDSSPPSRSNGQPTGTLSAGTTQTTLSLTTNETATCRYATTAGVSYASMTNTFTTTGGTSHSTSVSGLTDGLAYAYYVRCIDGTGNTNTNDFAITFSVGDSPQPSISIANRSLNEGNAGTTNAVVTLTLSAAKATAVTVNFATANGSATAGSDYTAASGTATFAANTTSTTVSIPVTGDTTVEPNETFVVNLSGAVGATIADAQATVTILNDDLPSISIADLSLNEGNSGTTNAVVTLTLSAAKATAVTVNFATANGSASAGSDYTATSGTATFAANTTSTTISIPVIGDTTVESNQTFVVNLSGAVGATIADSQATVTILNDDASITIANLSLNEGNSGTTNAVVTLTLSSAKSTAVTVNYATANGSATAGSDYTARSGTATFAANTTSTTISIPVIGDTTAESNETFVVNLSSPVGATIADAQATVTITNDDPLLTIGNSTVTEANTSTVSAVFTVTLSPAVSSTVTVSYATVPGTATAGSDYTATSGQLTFTPGATSRTITVPVLGDSLDEASETFTVQLSAPTNAALGTPSSGTGTITDNDATPSLSVNNVSVTEGNGPVTATFTVTLSAVSGRTVSVNYATSNGSATVAAGDYVAKSGSLSFAPGTTTQSVSVTVNGDVLDENSETFNLDLNNASAATIADSRGVATITDDDPTPTLSINDVSVTEGNSGTQNVTFTVTLSAVSGRTVTVAYATASGSAVATLDYFSRSGTETFNPGVVSQTFTVPIVGDLIPESNETFVVNLSSASGASIADGQGVCTIVNND